MEILPRWAKKWFEIIKIRVIRMETLQRWAKKWFEIDNKSSSYPYGNPSKVGKKVVRDR